MEDSELFYYFVESTGKPRIDPLLLYLIGGPGCSGLNGLFYQTGMFNACVRTTPFNDVTKKKKEKKELIWFVPSP